MSTLFQSLGGGMPMFGNVQNMIQQFNQFRSGFSGNAKEQVQQLLNSGRMSQQQFNQLQQTANHFMRFLK